MKYTITHYVFTIVHEDEDRPISLDDALYQAYEGHAVGSVTEEVSATGRTLDEIRPTLLDLGNDGTFFDEDNNSL